MFALEFLLLNYTQLWFLATAM